MTMKTTRARLTDAEHAAVPLLDDAALRDVFRDDPAALLRCARAASREDRRALVRRLFPDLPATATGADVRHRVLTALGYDDAD
jgi:hypothetical protein